MPGDSGIAADAAAAAQARTASRAASASAEKDELAFIVVADAFSELLFGRSEKRKREREKKKVEFFSVLLLSNGLLCFFSLFLSLSCHVGVRSRSLSRSLRLIFARVLHHRLIHAALRACEGREGAIGTRTETIKRKEGSERLSRAVFADKRRKQISLASLARSLSSFCPPPHPHPARDVRPHPAAATGSDLSACLGASVAAAVGPGRGCLA